MKLTSRRRTMPVRDRASDRRRRQQRSSTRNTADTHTPEDDHRVGPGRPPKEHPDSSPAKAVIPRAPGAKRPTKTASVLVGRHGNFNSSPARAVIPQAPSGKRHWRRI